MIKLYKLRKYSIVFMLATLFISVLLSFGQYIDIFKNNDNTIKLIFLIIYLIMNLNVSIALLLYLYNSKKNNNYIIIFSLIFITILDVLLAYYAYRCVFTDCMLLSIIKLIGINVIYSRSA